MGRWVALLRGVNVGGNRKLPMTDFRGVLANLGYGDVVTHLQSGNAVFSAPGPAPALESAIATALHAEVGIETRVLVRSGAEMTAVVADNPYPAAMAEPKTLHVAFLSGPAPAQAVAGIERGRFAPDEFEARGSLVYVHLPGGFAATKLTNDRWERWLGVASTMRNWNTVTALAGLADGS